MAQAPWQASLLANPAAGKLILAGGLLDDPSSPVVSGIVDDARATGSHRILVVAAGYPSVGQGSSTGNDYAKLLANAGWKESTDKVEVISYGPNGTGGSLTPSRLDGVAAVLLVGGDQSALAPAIADSAFVSFVHAALDRAPEVVTDRAMTAAMGAWYVAASEPTATTTESTAAAAFLDGAPLRAGLGIFSGLSFEPRFTLDQRWGLVAATKAHPDTIALGISERTALVLDSGGATVAGERSVAALDGRAATYASGSNGAFTALNTVLDLFASGEAVDPGA